MIKSTIDGLPRDYRPEEEPAEDSASVPPVDPETIEEQEDEEGTPASSGPDRGERELILRAQSGDMDAFRVIVERYEARAYWPAYNVVGNTEDARDIAQEAFTRVYRGLHRFDPSRRFGTWLYRIVMNLAIDFLRKKKVRRLHTGMDDLPEAADPQEGWVERAIRADRRERVHLVLERLPPNYREILLLRDIEGIPAKEIAKILGITHATVRWRVHQGRKLFRRAWERLEASGEEKGCSPDS